MKLKDLKYLRRVKENFSYKWNNNLICTSELVE